MKFVIGRSPESNLVLNHACVSSRHASIEDDGRGGFRLTDEGSSNGTFINNVSNEVRQAVLHEDDVVFFSEEYQVPGTLLLKKYLAWKSSGGRARGVLSVGQVHRFAEPAVRLGSAADNHVVLPYLDIAPHHAVITRERDGYILQDLDGGCVVNGQRVNGGTVRLRPAESLEIGDVLVSTSYDPAGSTITVGTERRGFYLTADDVTFTVPDRRGPRRLVDHVGFSVLPGELVGLMGPSGCGKTTLLTCLCGVLPADGVFYNGEPLASAAATCANVIGYVPQDDILYPELTVRETLFYSARLRLSARTSTARIYAKIDEVCATLKLWDPPNRLDLRDLPVGSPERKTISGGQKKRVALAMELLTDPLALLLDEPTSGLSSADTVLVMESLRRLTDEKGIPVIITIHQPSLRVYQKLDHVLYLKGGQLAWFGPAYPDSVKHFVADGAASAGADEIMEVVDGADAGAMRDRYRAGRYAQKFVDGRKGLIQSLTRSGDLARRRQVRPMHLPGQTLLLLRRQFIRRWRDRVSLAIQLGQAPLLGLLVGVAFRDDRLNSPLFLLGFTALWFGTNVGARELVNERVIFRREKRNGVSPLATLFSKLAVHGATLLLQCVLLLLGAHWIIGFDLALPLGVLILWFCGLCGLTLGFVISALARTELAATAAAPLVLIPLILFGGCLTAYDNMPDGVKLVSQAMPSRWGYEALVQAEKLRRPPRAQDDDLANPRAFTEFSQPEHGHLDDSDRAQRVRLSLEVLAATGCGLAAVTWFLLWRVS